MANKRFTRQQMEYMMDNYGSDAAIARHLGVTRQSVQQQRKKLGVPSRLERIPERNNSAIKLYDQGMTVHDISKRIGLSQQSINRIIKSRRVTDGSDKQ